MGMTSDMYTQEIGPNEQEKMTVTQKMKKTPAMERPLLSPAVFWLFMTASQTRAMVMRTVPTRRGLRRPTRSRKNVMKMRSRLKVSGVLSKEVREHTSKRANAVVNSSH